MKTLSSQLAESELTSLYESILDADLDDMTDKVNDVEQIKRIQDFINSRFWEITKPGKGYYGEVKYNYGKDEKGYYIETENYLSICRNGACYIHSVDYFFNDQREKYNKFEKYDCPPFYWKSHKGIMVVPDYVQAFDSLEGMPEKIDTLFMGDTVGI